MVCKNYNDSKNIQRTSIIKEMGKLKEIHEKETILINRIKKMLNEKKSKSKEINLADLLAIYCAQPLDFI